MPALPYDVDVRLKSLGLYVERMGRRDRGRPTVRDRRWYFCGWYWHRGTSKRVNDGPHGPFPCWSAAAVDALRAAEEFHWSPDMRMLTPAERDMVAQAKSAYA